MEHRCYCSYSHEDDPDNKVVNNLEVPIGWPSYLEFSNNTSGVTRAKKPSSLRLLRQYLKYALRLAKEGDKYCLDDEQSKSNRWWPEMKGKLLEAVAEHKMKWILSGLSTEDCDRIVREYLPSKTSKQVKRQARTYFESLDAEAQAIRQLTPGDSYVKSVLGTDTIDTSELLKAWCGCYYYPTGHRGFSKK